MPDLPLFLAPLLRGAMVGLLVCMVSCLGIPPLGSQRGREDLSAAAAGVPEEWAAPIFWQTDEIDGWVNDFSDTGLSAMVAEALAANPDLKSAAARVAQSRAQVGEATAALMPALEGGGNASRAQRPGDQRFPGLGQRANRFSSALDISWELDLWGRLADQRTASLDELKAVQSDFHAARLSLTANTVKAAITLAEAHEQVRLAESDIDTRRTQLGLLEKQLDRGIETEQVSLDVSLSRTDLARIESTLTEQRRIADVTRRNLETLVGRYPAGREAGLGALPTLRRGVPAGVPATVLLRRPDLLAAESRLRATLGRESAAKKAFLPSIRLTGDRGFSSQELANLVTTQSTIWTLASGLTQPLFQGGRLRAGLRRAQAQYDEALNDYASTVLIAFREVETALAAEQFYARQEGELKRALDEALTSERLALGQYERGLADVLTLLDSRRRAFDAERALITVQADRLRNRADLHLALGGDFE